MTELAPRHYPRQDFVSRPAPVSRFGGQPVIIGAAALAIIVLGIGSIVMWRAYTGTSPELDRVASTRQLQARTAQASEQLVEKTRGLEATQQESIDQLQVVQDQLTTVRRLLAANRPIPENCPNRSALTESIDGLRQSFASAQTADPAPAARKYRAKPKAVRSAHRKRGKSQG